MRGFIDFIDDFVTGSAKQIQVTALLFVVGLLLGLSEPINYLCLVLAAWHGILFVLNVYSWDYQRRHNNQQGQ